MTVADIAAKAAADAGRWRPFAPRGLISAAVVGTLCSAALFAVYGTIIGAQPAFWVVLVAAATVFVWLLVTLRRTHERVGFWTLYLVPGAGAVLLTGFVLASGLEPGRFAIAYALLAVVTGASFPLAGQIVLHTVTATGYGLVLAVRGAAGPDLLVPVALYAVVAYVAGTFSRGHQEAIAREADAAEDASRRADLLRAAADIHNLDSEQAAEAAVHAMAELGFEIATLAAMDETHTWLVPIASVGMAEEIRREPVPADGGLAGHALTVGDTVEVEDYHRFTGRLPGREAVRSGIAVPIDVGGRRTAVLQGGRRSPGRCTLAEREIVEVLAEQVGRAFENARAFEEERQIVERLRQLDGLKNEFVSNVSHELRTPLTVIQGLGQTLAARRVELDVERRRDLLRRVAANAERLGAMIDAMLDFSRFETDGVRPSLQTVDLGRLARLAAERMEPLLQGRPLDVAIESALVECDPALIEHVVENLLGNAAKHTPAGTSVRVAVETSERSAWLVVEDRGEGIAAEELPHLTERFYRGAVHSRQPSPGLGLGLALVRQILEGHGTQLEVANVPEGGARFAFRLPLAPVASTVS